MKTIDGIKIGTMRKNVMFIFGNDRYYIDPKRAREFAKLLLDHAQSLDYKHPCHLCGSKL